MLLLRSDLLSSFPHGFTTREGGVSPPPWESLNLGGLVGDDPERVAENWRRLSAETGLRFARVRQVHGDRVIAAPPPGVPREEADGVISTERGVAACVSVADCVPVLLADPDTGAVAAVHAGWRGTVADIAARAVEALEALGARRDRLVAALGPHICPDCFEVGDEVAAPFEPLAAVVRKPAWPKPHVDLYAANRRLLARAGVETVDERPPCTMHEPARFFSFRRDGGQIGQMLSFVTAAPATR